MRVGKMVRRMATDLKTDRKMIKVFLVILFLDFCQCAVTVSPQKESVKQGTSITIIATTDEAAVTWTYKSGSSLSLCSISSSFCVVPTVENMVLSADASTNTSTITISAVNCSINHAVYIATTSLDVATAEIDVTTPASSIDITTSLSTQKVSTQELSFNIPCVDPQPVVNFTITRQGKPDETLDDVTVSSSSSGCQCTEATYTIRKTITASNYPNEVVNVTANVGQLSPVLIGTVNFTGRSPDSPKSNMAVIIGVVVGSIFALILIALVILKVCKHKGHQSKSKDKGDMLVPSAQKFPEGTGTKLVPSAQKTTGGTGTPLVPSAQKTPVVPGTQIGPLGTEGKPHIDYHKGMPLEPEGPLKIKTRQDQVEFQWKPPKSDGGSQITEYIVEVHGTKFDTWEPFASSPKIKLQVPMDKFKNGEVMSFRVRAENENGSSKPLLAQEPFKLQNSHDILSDRPVVTNQGRGPAGQGSLLDEVPSGRKLPEPV